MHCAKMLHVTWVMDGEYHQSLFIRSAMHLYSSHQMFSLRTTTLFFGILDLYRPKILS